MTVDEAVIAVLDALATAGIPYMVVGSLASNVHGIPRSTLDADVVVATIQHCAREGHCVGHGDPVRRPLLVRFRSHSAAEYAEHANGAPQLAGEQPAVAFIDP